MQRISDRLYNWASILDEQTLEQARRTSAMPFIHPHVALMPDAHLGKGATVGSVIPTLGAIMPAAVGVDIGCGMIAVRTGFRRDELLRLLGTAGLAALRTSIEQSIPLSAGRYNARLEDEATERRVARLSAAAEAAGFDPATYAKNWTLQLGSLGSGNHFIEVTVDEDDTVWLFLHSGSRGVGNRIAQHHIGAAQAYDRRHAIEVPDRDLAYLVEGTAEFDRYIAELRWAQEFALANREEMMDRVIAQVTRATGTEVVEQERINCHHNYTVHTSAWGEDVWLSRKGAIDASLGTPGLIPGSMGTASYVVVGRGNRMSLDSSPHGAGREFSRTAARKRFTREQLREAMRGIEYRDTDAFLDEIPQAYKPIDRVMEDAADLVEVRHTLRQIVNVKGD
ncbi:MAG TPA: RtcB family protein [Naasia sp.]|jgi:tRNA-splicing ligase RtcB